MGERRPERRRWPRYDTRGQLRAEVASLDAAEVVVLNVSEGGLGVESTAPFAAGNLETFRFATKSGDDLGELRAEVVMCRMVPGQSPRYITGFAFVDPDDPTVRARVASLLEAARVTV